MRTFVFLAALALVAGQVTEEEMGSCVVDSGEAISDAMDASMFIWASIARCGHSGEEVKCQISLSSAVASLNSMINVILKTADKCGALKTVNKECGIAASELTEHVAAIATAGGGVSQKCFQGPAHGLNWNHGDAAQCVLNIKNTAKDFFKIIKSLMKIEKTQPCADGDTEACAQDALQIVGAFAGIGEYLAGSVGQCSPSGAYKGSVCAQESTKLVQQLTDFSERAITVSRKCGTTDKLPERLYSMKGAQVGFGTNIGGSTNIILGAFLPLTAIVGFVGGRFYGSRTQTREVMSDGEM